MMAKILLLVLSLALVGFFLSYRLLNTPLGLTADEGAFGYNATLLSKTGYDQNGKFLPIFVLSLEGRDWRQPVTQYYMALFFRFFGSTVFNLRFSSVIISLVCIVLIFWLTKRLFNDNFAFLATSIFITTPLVLIQSHMGLDNIMPVPFVLLWLIFLYLFGKTNHLPFLVLAGVSLGISFYTYKGMRATVPVWAVLTIYYLFAGWTRETMRRVTSFIIGLAPFFLCIPYLEYNYPNAIFDHQKPEWSSWYDFLYPYLSSFDLGFLYITGDVTPWHSTGKHGMMLLTTLPLFLTGIPNAIKKRGFWLLILLAFFTAPALYGFVHSVHRASRLMSMIPSYVLLCTLGAAWWWEKKKIVLVLMLFVGILNYGDFTRFYWYEYPELTRVWFGDLTVYRDYETFYKRLSEYSLDPYVDSQMIGKENISGQFYEVTYFPDNTQFINIKDYIEPPSNALFMTEDKEVPGMLKLEVPMVKYNLYVNQK